MSPEQVETDILILGSGGAGLFAALHAKKIAPDLDVTVAVKGLMGKCGCTRMVQGGYNVALAPGESFGAQGEGWARISLAVTDDVFNLGLERLLGALQGTAVAR